MYDISGFGSSVMILSSSSFPQGFSLTSFADDTDPIAIEPTEVSGFEPLYDGDIFTFDKAAPVLLSVSVIPASEDDINLKILLQMRKSNSTFLPFEDIVTMIITYPEGGRVVLSQGRILKGPLADSLAASGRKKGNTYHFVFGSFAGAQSVLEVAATAFNVVSGLL